MTRILGALVAVSLAGCFAHHHTLRNVALATEAATIAGGVVVSSVTPEPQTNCFGGSSFIPTCNTSHSNLELVGPALIIGGAIALVTTLVTSHESPAPAPAPAPVLAPAAAVGPPGATAVLGVSDAWTRARRYCIEHAIRLDANDLRDIRFDGLTRRWTFDYEPEHMRISVAESGDITVATAD